MITESLQTLVVLLVCVLEVLVTLFTIGLIYRFNRDIDE